MLKFFILIFSALIECHLDAGKKTDATGIAGPAASFIKQNVPQLYKQVFGLIVSFISICYVRLLLLKTNNAGSLKFNSHLCFINDNSIVLI